MARPSVPAEQRRVDLGLTLSPEIRQSITILSEKTGQNLSRTTEMLIERGLRSLLRRKATLTPHAHPFRPS